MSCGSRPSANAPSSPVRPRPALPPLAPRPDVLAGAPAGAAPSVAAPPPARRLTPVRLLFLAGVRRAAGGARRTRSRPRGADHLRLRGVRSAGHQRALSPGDLEAGSAALDA